SSRTTLLGAATVGPFSYILPRSMRRTGGACDWSLDTQSSCLPTAKPRTAKQPPMARFRQVSFFKVPFVRLDLAGCTIRSPQPSGKAHSQNEDEHQSEEACQEREINRGQR